MHFLHFNFLLVIQLFPLLEEGVKGRYWHPLDQRQPYDEILDCWLLRLHDQLYGGGKCALFIGARTIRVYIGSLGRSIIKNGETE